MATTGRLGSIYSQLGNVELGVDNEGHPLTPVAALYVVPAHGLAAVAALGDRKERAVTATLAVSRPPGREIPAALAAFITAGRPVPAALAAFVTISRVVPAALAAHTTSTRVVLAALAVAVPDIPALQAPRRESLLPHLLEAFTPLYDREPAGAAMLTLDPLPGSPGMPWRVSGSLFEITALPTITPATPATVERAARPGRTDGVYRGVPLQAGASALQGTVTPATGIAPFIRDLRRLTLGELAAELTAAGYPATAAADFADLTATTLIDGHGDIVGDGAIPGYTSLLWRILRALALGGEQLLDDIDLGVRQLDLRFAAGRWLDWWGELYAAPREPLEGDDDYRRRVVWSVTRPRTNNTAIARILAEVTGIGAYVTDDRPVGVSRGDYTTPEPIDRTWSPGQDTPGTYFPGYPPRFTVAIPPGTPVETTAKIGRLTARLRAAGVTYRVAEYASIEHPLATTGHLDFANGARYTVPTAALWANQAHDLGPAGELLANQAHDLTPQASVA